MKNRVFKVCYLGLIITGCSQPVPSLKSATAMGGNVNLSIPTDWENHQIMHGWASDCNGCSYSEASDYFGEDLLVQVPITPPKRNFCMVSSKIRPGSLQRAHHFKPNVKETIRVLKVKDPSAANEDVLVSLKNRTVEVSYKGLMDKGGPIYYQKTITYFGSNREIKVWFKGQDSPKFRETVAAMRNSIRISPAFLNEEIDK